MDQSAVLAAELADMRAKLDCHMSCTKTIDDLRAQNEKAESLLAAERRRGK